MTRVKLAIATLFIFSFGLNAQKKGDKNKDLINTSLLDNTELYTGFFNFNYHSQKDQLFLSVDKLDQEFLYVNSLSQGIGSNDIGLDRGQLGNERIVYFTKTGNKLLLVQPNLKYRSTSDNPLEQRSIKEAFAKSVLYSFPIEEMINGSYIINLTSFLLEDAHGVSKRLKQRKQGTFKIDKGRSAVYLDRTKAFPLNIEFDMLLTFTGSDPGNLLRSVSPTPNAITVNQHHSFVSLPDSDYETRKFDPRSGVNALSFYDYSSPVNESTQKQYIYRHRLEKKDPSAENSEAIEPIIYYLDNGTPEPVRSALIEGGSWWNQAFESIGYKDAFQVKILPDDADPLDVRYNVIQWVHRSTRGWSYGSSVADPRTGEIIKGHVSLGSLRIRQDFMIALGLTEAPFDPTNNKEYAALELALARIRQLSAHEIGHTLGFAHNFAASAKSRTSVMDYPHPYLTLENDKINYSKAYENGIGSWDKVSVGYAYSDFPDDIDESKELNLLLENSLREGHLFISDNDARPIGGAHPKAHLWDNGSSATDELNSLMQIRSKALNQLSLNHIKEGAPYSDLEDLFVPMYLLHRYQVEAVVKMIGGVDYNYAVKGPIPSSVKVVSPIQQRNALLEYLNTLNPKALKIPSHLNKLLHPRSFSNPRTRENFLSQTGVTFDYIGIATSLSDALIGMLLHPERANRLVMQFGFDKNQLSLKETLNILVNNHFKKTLRDTHENQLNEIVKGSILKHLMQLGQNSLASNITKAIIYEQLETLDRWLAGQSEANFSNFYRMEIQNYFDNPSGFNLTSSKRLPDGSPIGSFSCDY
ncbi:MAG: zinc-dependent metalloprotease [Flavobacteriaceae bacterium]|nr:zinc-dependent metalloprotease [Flavobacteriaceae bacterium]